MEWWSTGGLELLQEQATAITDNTKVTTEQAAIVDNTKWKQHR
jgi:hypothetical protein